MTKFKETGKKILLLNDGRIIASSGFIAAANGSFTLATNLSAKTLIFPLKVKAGDKILSFKVLGTTTGAAGAATTVDADLRRIKHAAAVVDASLGAITQVSNVTVATDLDSSKVINHVVAKDYQYYVLITVTTGNDGATLAAITGVEVTIA